MDYSKIRRDPKRWFSWKEKLFYKHDHYPDEIWINKEILIQLNLTSTCPLNCDFCYVKHNYGDDINLYPQQIYRLWRNLRQYPHDYRVNLTGGDLFYYPYLQEILEFLRDEKTVVAVDPLINRPWKEEHKRLLEIIGEKISFVQMNSDIVKEEDIEWALENEFFVVLKYALYPGLIKRNKKRIITLAKKYENVVISFDMIIPQRRMSAQTYINNISQAIQEIQHLLKDLAREGISEERVLSLHPTLEREVFNRTYLCAVGIQGVYVMPDGKIAVCSRFPHLETGYTLENFDLYEFLSKYNKLVSNTCLFENKYYGEFWKR